MVEPSRGCGWGRYTRQFELHRICLRGANSTRRVPATIRQVSKLPRPEELRGALGEGTIQEGWNMNGRTVDIFKRAEDVKRVKARVKEDTPRFDDRGRRECLYLDQPR